MRADPPPGSRSTPPRPEAAAASWIARYLDWLERERGLSFPGYAELWQWSVDDIDAFWQSVWDFFEVQASVPPRAVLGSRAMPGAEWFPGAELSWAEHVFRGKRDDALAIVHASETRPGGELTWGELRDLTARIAAGLRALGVERGDRVAAYLPNGPEAVAALLATASLGAIWSSCSPDFGATAVVDRLAQIEPKVLLAVDGYRYGGKAFDRLDVVRALQQGMPWLERTVVVPYLAAAPDLSGLDRAISWPALLAAGTGGDPAAPAPPLAFAQLPFAHPLWVLYSSGTTGLPKAIVHGQGGILLEHLKSVHFHLDLHPGDRFFWFSTTGWMMWNVVVAGLLSDAAVVLYDGSPGVDGMGVLWDLAERAGITCFGTSAAYIAACMKAGVEPRAGRDLSRLRAVGSTGSPLSPEGFRWVYDQLGDDVWLFSTSGGTDACTSFVGGVPTLPVVEGELQARLLGARVESFDELGRSLVGEVGELVITEPLPTMPVGFWNDPDGSRYRESYFEHYPGVWRHGDWIEITPRGSAIISGRSDATINRAGVRIGTSEIYRAVLALPEIADALVVDLPLPGTDGWMPLFVVTAAGVELDDALRARIARAVRDACSPRHVPDEVRAIAEVPRTLSGKPLEVPVKRILLGADPAQVASRDSLANPAALDVFVALAAAGTYVPRPA